jgi:hypothetical protein
VAAPVSLLQVFRVSSRQLYSLIHGQVQVLRYNNNGPVAGGLTQTQYLDISKNLTVTCTLLNCVVCKGRYGNCAYCVIKTPQTKRHNVGRSIAVFPDSEASPICPSEKCSTQVECRDVEQ